MSNDEHECPHCGCNCNHGDEEHEGETTYLNVTIEEPEDMIARYLEYFESQISDKQDLINYLGAFYNDIYALAVKRLYLLDIDFKMEAIAKMEEEFKHR